MSVNIKKEFGGAKNRRPDLTTLVYGKVPPQAPDLEEAVLGACMLEKDTFAQVLEIIQSEECFYVDAHQKIYAAMRRLFDKGIPVDLLTITDELRDANELEIVGGAYYLTRLTMSVLTSAHVEAHARIVMEKFIQRELIRISGNIIGDAYEDSSDVFDLLDKAESNLYEITDKHLRKNFRSLKDVMVRTVGEIEESMKKTDDLTGVPSGFAALDRITGGWQRSDLIILAARPSVGKCFGKGTKILMFDGSLKNVEDIVVGDKIMGDDSTCRNVLALGRGREMMYWVRQLHGIDYRVNESHIISLKRSRNEFNKKHGDVVNISIREYLLRAPKFKNNHKGYKKAVEFKEQPLPIPPYLLGLWLGDGSSAKPQITKPDIEIRNYLQKYADDNGYKLRVDSEFKEKCNSYSITGINGRKGKNFVELLRAIDVFKNKHIPDIYLVNSRENRLQLLAGLLDTDGYNMKHSKGFEIVQKSKRLHENIRRLCDSLGFKTIAKVKYVKGNPYYRLYIFGKVDEIPMLIERKKYKSITHKRDFTMNAIKVEPDIVDDYYGFEIDGNKLFMLEDCTVTHNTALCLNIAMNAAMNAAKEFPVAIFSLEMGAGQIVKRMLSAVTEVSMESITRGKMSDGEFMQMTQRMEKLSKAKIFVDDQAALNIFELRAKARRLKQKHGIELIVIDYLQLMQGSVEKSGNREQEISKISRDLKALAKELDIPIIALSQLNRSVETRKESKMPQLSDLRECLSVETSNIYTSGSFQKNSLDDMGLLSLHEGKIISTNSHNIEKTKNEVFRLKTQSGRFVDATAKHKILTSDGYKKLGEINNTDSVAIALNWTNPEGVYIPQAKFIGWMLGNGSMLASHAPAFITRDPIIAKKFVSFIEEEFGFKPKPHKHHKSKVFQYDVVKDSVRTSDGNPATKWLRERQMWGYTAKDKKIPDWLLAQADEKSICELLQGLWETDGSIEIGQKGKKRERISYSTTSLLLANQMLYLLAKLGIVAILDNGYLSKKATTKCYKLIIEGEEKNKFAKKISLDGYKGDKLKSLKMATRQSYLSNVLSRSTTLEIHANVKFVGITKRLVQIHGKRRLTKASLAKIINCHPFIYEKYNWLLSDGIYWDKVDSITSMGVVEVFDRNVPVSGNFVVNGITLSNSGALEQDADLVMFLYRPEYYGINNDAMGETVEGETHINIAKHRNGSTGIEKLRFIKEYQKFVDFDDDQFGGFNDGGFTGNPGRDPRAGGDATVGSFLKGGGNSNPYAGIRRDPSEFGGSKMFIPGGFQVRPSAANDVNWDDDNSTPPVRKTPPDEDVPF